MKTLAISNVKKWKVALLTDDSKIIMELVKLETPTKEDQGKMDKNQSAWTYLILACKDKPVSIVADGNDVDTYRAWWYKQQNDTPFFLNCSMKLST
jgi:hypothetical protein